MADRRLEERAARSGPTVRVITTILGLFGSVAFAMALYLRAPIERKLLVPSGADIPVHLWRVRLVTAQGLRALFDSAPLSIQTNPDRLGLPVLASILSGLGVTPWRLMYVTAAIAAAVVACSAWGLARTVPEPRWAAPIYSVALVASIPFALTSRAYLDNVLAEGLILAIAATALVAATARGATAAGILLTAGTLLMHWPTGTLFLAVLLGFAACLLPSAIAARKAGGSLATTGAARVGAIAVGGLALGGLPLLATPGGNAPAEGSGRLFVENVERLLPFYRLRLMLPLAALGAGALAWLEPRAPRRRTLALCAAWLLPLGVAAIVYARVRPVPLMRFFGTALALPLLGAAAFAGLIALAVRAGRSTAVRAALAGAASLLVVAALAVSAVRAAHSVENASPSIDPFELAPVRAADAFLAATNPPAAVVVVDGPTKSFRRIRMLAPGTIVDRIRVYPGTAKELFARTEAPGPPVVDPSLVDFKRRSAQIAADAVEWMRTPGAVALAVRPFLGDYDTLLADPANVEVADGVLVLRPGTPPQAVTPTRLSAPPSSALVWSTLMGFAALLLAGSGWSVALLAHSWELRLALAPAIGMAVLVVVGTLLGLAGASTGSTSGLLLWIAVIAAGWAAAAGVQSTRTAPGDIGTADSD
jgi:hypothetical protein